MGTAEGGRDESVEDKANGRGAKAPLLLWDEDIIKRFFMRTRYDFKFSCGKIYNSCHWLKLYIGRCYI